MRTIPLGKTGLAVPAVALGCMRLTALDERGAQTYVRTALEYGANFFDHADIYGGGTCEELFGKAIAGIPREELIIQSKCGIVPGKRYDFSREHILRSVDESLKRLKVDALPDAGEADAQTIYLVPAEKSDTGNVYDEFMVIDGAWERIGSTQVDLTGYVQEGDLTELGATKVQSIWDSAMAS